MQFHSMPNAQRPENLGDFSVSDFRGETTRQFSKHVGSIIVAIKAYK